MKKERTLALSFISLVLASAAMAGLAEEISDPVCGMKIDPSKAKFTSEYKGQKYYFCSADCLAKFDQNPEKYVQSAQKAREELVVCCSLSKEWLAEVKIEKKEIKGGLEVTMTSDNPEVVKKLQETLERCQQDILAEAEEKPSQKKRACGEHDAYQQHLSERGSLPSCRLMGAENYKTKAIKLNNGLRLELKKR